MAGEQLSFPPGTTLAEEIAKVMQRLEATGVRYPPGFAEALASRCADGLEYPRILMRVGEPRIRLHPRFADVLRLRGRLLDYGCGTGDDLRALVADGYSKDAVVGFDVSWQSIDLGFDLYQDRSSWEGAFVVGSAPPFPPASFSAVYSGSVLHSLRSRAAQTAYLSSAAQLLKDGGLLFGSTLEALDIEGRAEPLNSSALRSLLEACGFSGIEVLVTPPSANSSRPRLWFSATKRATAA